MRKISLDICSYSPQTASPELIAIALRLNKKNPSSRTEEEIYYMNERELRGFIKSLRNQIHSKKRIV